FEGAPEAVDEQAHALGGDEADPWAEVRTLQAGFGGSKRWDGSERAPLVRPGPRVAYVEEAPERRWRVLAERVVEALCSGSCSRTASLAASACRRARRTRPGTRRWTRRAAASTS